MPDGLDDVNRPVDESLSREFSQASLPSEKASVCVYIHTYTYVFFVCVCLFSKIDGQIGSHIDRWMDKKVWINVRIHT